MYYVYPSYLFSEKSHASHVEGKACCICCTCCTHAVPRNPAMHHLLQVLCDCVQASTHVPTSDSGFKRLGRMPGNDWPRTKAQGCIALHYSVPLPLKAGRNPWSWKPEPLSVSPLCHNSSRPQRLYFLSVTLFSSFSISISISQSLSLYLTFFTCLFPFLLLFRPSLS